MSLIEEHIHLANDIAAGKISANQLEEELSRIENEYGASAFNSFKVTRKDPPWTNEDLEDLRDQSSAGACSKEFYRYMVEVSESVYKNNSGIGGRIIRFAKKNWLLILCCVVLICICVFVFTQIRK